MRLRIGTQLGKYKIEKKLGSGTFADVWRARDTVEQRKVALKVVLPDGVKEFGRETLEREARIAARLSHPNILAIRNADWVQGSFIIATDLAKTSLEKHRGVWRSGRMALDVIRQVSAGLAYAHEMRVLHRDIKPENILLFPDGRAAISDFGLSLFAPGRSRTMTEAGTLGYMAPEAAYGRGTFSSDVFSLALVAYELLTGFVLRWPFEWPTDGYRSFVKKVPPPVRTVLQKAASFQPRRRFQDGIEFHRTLSAAFRRHETAPVRRAKARRRKRKRNRIPTALGAHASLFKKHFARALELRYECKRCSGAIAEEMMHCPWCGASDNGFHESTRYPIVCPTCDRGARPGWNACPWCPERFTSNGRAPPLDRMAERTCARRGCDGQLRRFMKYCPMCKRKVKQLWSHEVLHDRCQRCRWPVSREFWRFCPWCRRSQPEAGSFKRLAT